MRFKSLLSAGLTTWLMHAQLAYAGAVGFSKLSVADPGHPPLEVGVWYPTTATPHPDQVGLYPQTLAPDGPVAGQHLPLVVMSHGHGGEFAGHSDTALALAEAGFVVAAPTHTGDNYRDDSAALDVQARTRHLHEVIDYMVTQWAGHAVDPSRIGAFGFSAGGFTVLAAAGGIPDMALFAPHCAAHPALYDCALTGSHQQPATPSALVHDGRIRAVVAAAPALGFAFAPAGLRDVTMPVQLWRAEDDQILPSPFYVEPVAAALPHTPDLHVVANAGHFDFLAPCPPALADMAPVICTSRPGFDRAALHRDFDAAVVAFFERSLTK
jgi:predicted dienelactone hydrolase